MGVAAGKLPAGCTAVGGAPGTGRRLAAAPLSLLFGKTAEGVVPLVGRGELVLATVRVFALALLDCLGPKFPHHEAVLPGVARRAVGRGVVRARAFEQLFVVTRSFPTEASILLFAVIGVGVGNQIRGLLMRPTLAVGPLVETVAALEAGVVFG